jgi:signal peptidase II
MILRFKIHRLCLVFSLLLTTIGCDQISKTLVRDSLPVIGSLSYLGDRVRLQYAENPGAFLNLGARLPETVRFWLFNVGVTALMLMLAFAVLRAKKPRNLIALTLILGGGLGNLIDRFAFGHVTDFILLTTGAFHTGIFNVADMMISLGVLILAFGAKPARGITASE